MLKITYIVSIVFLRYHMNEIKLQQEHSCFKGETLNLTHIKMPLNMFSESFQIMFQKRLEYFLIHATTMYLVLFVH